ncbi:hypothetical protein EC844_1401 [Acinetobacter calcoaceticus]|uniref:Lipoprotein n=1 Tax=Acinetobacter calcoaceticus TaxID=471 RepID=A0A4R1XAZ0_ACICA|nr:hypothetical protein EC844_1401 [Acinetobacter calcoaceticus]
MKKILLLISLMLLVACNIFKEENADNKKKPNVYKLYALQERYFGGNENYYRDEFYMSTY